MYLPIVQLTAEADWHLRRTVTDPARTRAATLLRERALLPPIRTAPHRRRFRWLPFRSTAPAIAP